MALDWPYEERLINRIALSQAIQKHLPERRGRFLKKYLAGATYADVAEEEGVSTPRARAITLQAVRELRRFSAGLRAPYYRPPPQPEPAEPEKPQGFDKAAFLKHMAFLIENRGRLEIDREAAQLRDMVRRETINKRSTPQPQQAGFGYPGAPITQNASLGAEEIAFEAGLWEMIKSRRNGTMPEDVFRELLHRVLRPPYAFPVQIGHEFGSVLIPRQTVVIADLRGIIDRDAPGGTILVRFTEAVGSRGMIAGRLQPLLIKPGLYLTPFWSCPSSQVARIIEQFAGNYPE